MIGFLRLGHVRLFYVSLGLVVSSYLRIRQFKSCQDNLGLLKSG
jgi:hypothetical protein